MQLVLDMKRIRKLNPRKSAQIPIRVLMYSGPLPFAVSQKSKNKNKTKKQMLLLFSNISFFIICIIKKLLWFTAREYVIWRQFHYVRRIFSPYPERRKWSEHYGYYIIWYQFSSRFKPYDVKLLSFLIQKFSVSLKLNFSALVGVVFIYFVAVQLL